MKRFIPFTLAIVLFISSCNVPVSTSAESAEAIQTYAALTVEAAISNGEPVPLASPTSSSQTNSGTVQATAPTSSSGEPSASFEDVTNCRTGPGVNYQRVTQILPNESVDIIGFYPPNYWVVSTDSGPCWVAGQFVTPTGNISAVPTVTAPPTPQGGAPQNVSISWNHSCNYVTNETNVTITWSDKEGETGYRVFRNNEIVGEMPANSTFFAETITLLAGQSVGYYIVAFNEAGETRSNTITFSC